MFFDGNYLDEYIGISNPKREEQSMSFRPIQTSNNSESLDM